MQNESINERITRNDRARESCDIIQCAPLGKPSLYVSKLVNIMGIEWIPNHRTALMNWLDV
uniref:Uncharacterized protein n=1 Tax=Romanomermis culicivorax TaxID=13658 RepID=A0A915JBZ5_ROMCU